MEDTQIIRLVLLAQQGDRAAFGELAKSFENTVFCIVSRRVRNYSDAWEVTQEVFIRAMRKLSQLREPERFCGWLKQIAVRLSINHLVRRPRESAVDSEVFDGVKAETRSPVDALMTSEQASQVWTGLRQLKTLDRDTLIAFYIEGQSIEQMSSSFRSPIGTIKRRLHTARNRLREVLGEVQPV
jgi:RNA polymerase sigma-70 factor (ECF subfamily)